MSESGLALVCAWAAAWSSGDLARLLACVSAEVVYEDTALGLVLIGQPVLRSWAAAVLAALPDLRLSPERVLQEGEQLAVQWQWQVTMQGEVHRGRGVSLVELAGGRISRYTAYYRPLPRRARDPAAPNWGRDDT